MLVFKRTKGEGIRIGDLEVFALETHRGWVKIGVQAPRAVVVERIELAPKPAPEGPAPKEPKPL